MAGIESWQDGCLSVSKLKDWGNFGTTDVINSDSFGHLKSCRRNSILVMLTQFKTNRMTCKGIQMDYDMETTLQKRKPIAFEYSTF